MPVQNSQPLPNALLNTSAAISDLKTCSGRIIVHAIQALGKTDRERKAELVFETDDGCVAVDHGRAQHDICPSRLEWNQQLGLVSSVLFKSPLLVDTKFTTLNPEIVAVQVLCDRGTRTPQHRVLQRILLDMYYQKRY